VHVIKFLSRKKHTLIAFTGFVFLFGTVGLALLLISRAATPTASFEPENATTTGTTTVNDATASNGKAVRFTPITPPTYFGTLTTSGARSAEESSKGIKAAMIEFRWDRYEPTTEGDFDEAYVAGMKSQFNAMRAAGMQVTLAMGVHFTPAWVKALPNSRFVNQNGATNSMLNVVYNQKIREKVQAYYAQIDKDFGMENFWALRVTSGGSSEILYPGDRTYWAYDANAQNGPDMPPSMARNPFPGWKPGDRSITTTQVGQWADWYLKALNDVANWQMTVMDGLGFRGYYQMLTPGSGVRPNNYTSDINTYLPFSYTGVGAVWDRFYANLPNKKNVVVYVSSVADNSGANDSCQPTDPAQSMTSTALNSWSATRWQARIATQHNLPIAGENPGYGLPTSLQDFYVDTSSTGMMASAIRQAQTCNFQTFYWAHDFRLYDGTQTLANYVSYITQLHGTRYPTPTFPN
jgi:hypothetical protein